MRQGFICIVFLTIVIISFVLVYVANVGAKKSTMSSNQLLGSEEPPGARALVDARTALIRGSQGGSAPGGSAGGRLGGRPRVPGRGPFGTPRALRGQTLAKIGAICRQP